MLPLITLLCPAGHLVLINKKANFLLGWRLCRHEGGGPEAGQKGNQLFFCEERAILCKIFKKGGVP